MCTAQAETTGHILWGCPAAKAIWSVCSSKIQKRSSEHEDFWDILSDLAQVLDQEDLERVAVCGPSCVVPQKCRGAWTTYWATKYRGQSSSFKS